MSQQPKFTPTTMEPSHVQLYNYIQLYNYTFQENILILFSSPTVALDWSGLGAVQSPT